MLFRSVAGSGAGFFDSIGTAGGGVVVVEATVGEVSNAASGLAIGGSWAAVSGKAGSSGKSSGVVPTFFTDFEAGEPIATSFSTVAAVAA